MPDVLWWPVNEDGKDNNRHVPDEARRICLSCPVRADCYRHAMRHERYGIWAGTSPRDRARIRRRLGRRVQPFEPES